MQAAGGDVCIDSSEIEARGQRLAQRAHVHQAADDRSLSARAQQGSGHAAQQRPPQVPGLDAVDTIYHQMAPVVAQRATAADSVSACAARYTALIAPADTPVRIGNSRPGARSA